MSILAKRYTLVLRAGSSTIGELHHESPRTGYMRNLGPATLMADGYLMRGGGFWMMPGQFRILPDTGRAFDDAVIASLLQCGESELADAAERSDRFGVAS